MKEYIVWQVIDRRFDWFSWQDGEYISLAPDAEGIIHSQVFPGLWLFVSALLEGDMLSVIATLQNGLSSIEHQDFLATISCALD